MPAIGRIDQSRARRADGLLRDDHHLFVSKPGVVVIFGSAQHKIFLTDL
jgi:hypothetical protein